jgi:hypothetical protein
VSQPGPGQADGKGGASGDDGGFSSPADDADGEVSFITDGSSGSIPHRPDGAGPPMAGGDDSGVPCTPTSDATFDCSPSTSGPGCTDPTGIYAVGCSQTQCKPTPSGGREVVLVCTADVGGTPPYYWAVQ